jgi:hypothetical protein
MFELTADFAHACFLFEEETGQLYWKHRPAWCFSSESERIQNATNSRYAGKIAGTLGNMGYINVRVRGRSFLAHRIIWLLKTGELPEEIDHINHVKSDNRWNNLRNVSRKENTRNVCMRTDNVSGQHGRSWDTSRNKWLVQAAVAGHKYFLGRFNLGEEPLADEVLENFYASHGFHQNHGKPRDGLEEYELPENLEDLF